MKITNMIAVAAIAGLSATAVAAGDPTPMGTMDDTVMVPEAPAPAPTGSLGSLGGAAPALLALLVIAAAAGS